jgi:hypothetical protein
MTSQPPAAQAPAALPAAGLPLVDAALVAEACKKSNVLWVRPVGSTRYHLAWHAWHSDAAYVVSGAEEQMLPLLNGQVEVVVRSKDNGARLVAFVARADVLPASDPGWEVAAAALSAARLNTTDPDQQRDRWASGALVTRLAPVRLASAGAGDDSSGSEALPPPGSPATTVGEHQPWHVRGRARTLRAQRQRDRR